MDRPVAVIEISSSKIKLVVGYVIEKEPVVIYALEKPIRGLVSQGTIVNFASLTEAMMGIKNIRDREAKIKLTVSEATLILPPLGFEIYQNEKTTNVVSPTAIIEKIDIQNVVSLVKKEAVTTGDEVVDIIPDAFALEEGRQFVNPPIGEKSNMLTIYAKIHTLPRHVVDDYRRILHDAGIRIKRAVISPFALVDLLVHQKIKLKAYVLIDMGADLTTFTLVIDNSLYGSTYLNVGGSRLSEQIMKAFGISFEEAEKLKIKYGYDNRVLNFAPPILKVLDSEGVSHTYSLNDLNKISKAFLDDYFAGYSAAFQNLFQNYGPEIQSIPLVFVGGFMMMNGIKEVIKEKFSDHQSIHFVKPDVIGARDASMSSVVGALIASQRYRGTLSDERVKVSQVERVQEQNK